MNSYKALHQQVFTNGDFKIVPIRFQDRMDIMKWRNEQMYHLRQAQPLTKESQDEYFQTVVASLFNEEEPKQLLFSYLKNDVCIGYGGLVHINWIDRNAEISFVMNTNAEKLDFNTHWVNYLNLIERVSYTELGFRKIYIYAFDLRPHLYVAAQEAGFFLDGRLDDHCLTAQGYKDVVIYSKLNKK
jgi:RimJ/RimL family protein N-acetyltransferase